MCIGLTLRKLDFRTVEIIKETNEFDALHSSSEDEKTSTDASTNYSQSQQSENEGTKKNYFFDRTLHENIGKPLHKEFSVEGFAIYIESGPQTRLLCFNDSDEHNAIE